MQFECRLVTTSLLRHVFFLEESVFGHVAVERRRADKLIG